MKKNILRIFSLFAILIITCSMFSRFVEDWMTPRVIDVSAKEQGSGSVINVHAIREDMDGMMAYAVIERQGVQPGLFTDRNPVTFCEAADAKATTSLYAGQKYVLYSTKPIWNNQEIIPIKKQAAIEDEYLLIFHEEEPASPEQLKACGFTDIKIYGNSARVRDANAKTPFMEDQLFAKLSDNGMLIQKAYSMNEAQQMKASVPKLLLVGVLLLVLVMLWGVLCRVIGKPTKAKVLITLGLIIFGFVGFYFALQAVHLPSSLLPERHIFDIKHYISIFNSFELGMY